MESIDFIMYFLFNFFLYGFIGWIIENVYCYFKNKHFQEEGFLNSPFKPMYAFAMAIIISVYSINPNTYGLVLMCMVIPTSIEYITGVLMKHYFNKEYWDYSKVKFNFQGIICARFSVYWTLLTFVGVRYIQPYIINSLYELIMPIWIGLAPTLLLGLLIDDIYTIKAFKIEFFKKNDNMA